ncbi:alpha/beta hydrolase [Endozoicomonas sp. SCSIO W0465]|uniref:alpha/beta hydrolase n=1 Tax=Endozoicomonas sp. SCSIO W0465 TaxID=2918516 RepID=UPI0020764029|nr:alpha/beta hydrolase [Endozoicomonas sp. SCSIO W0465]USE34630.1 alpha/beta hydrolase [Endozoicomonas sp. SCSIO W0465]
MTYPESTPSLVTITTPAGNHRIPVYQWLAENNQKAVVHISHGMAEHGARYQELAEQLAMRGFHVYAHDHRGHGATIKKDKTAKQGHFGDHDGWNHVVQDLKLVVDHIIAQHASLPCFLLGHSMGSYILQSYLGRYNPPISGAILSGSNYVTKPLLMLARLVCKIEILRQGVMGHSPVIHQLTFAGYNNRFKPNTTEFDWLSRNPESVERYIRDPLCGFRCSNQLWYDLFGGLQEISTKNTLKKINNQLPILIIGGDQDPVSAPDGLKDLQQAFISSGHGNTTLTLYPEARHELFHETNHQEVITQLCNWLDKHR